MALALLEFEPGNGRMARFRMELGSNRYWSWTIGDGRTVERHGIPILANVKHASPLLGPLPPQAMGRGKLDIPRRLLDRRNRFIQLVSYRSRDRVGPAFSDIQPVPGAPGRLAELPDVALQEEPFAMEHARVDSVAFDVPPPRMSEAMFLSALTGMLPTLLPSLGSVLGGLLGGGKNGKPGGALGGILETLAKPETAKLIQGLLGQLAGAKSLDTALPASPRDYADSLSVAEWAEQKAMLAEAKAIPAALLAALPALMPLLGKILNPETLKTVLGHLGPEKTIAAVTDSIEKIGGLGLKGQQQLMGHIEKLHPKLAAEDAIIKMVENMAVARSVEPRYRRVESVSLSFPGLTTIEMYGRERVVYRAGDALSFPVDVETPRTIRGATLQLVIKDAASLEVLDHRTWRLEAVQSGPLSITPSLPAARAERLKPGEDYLVSVCVTWRNRSGRRVGACRQTLVTLAREYAFDRVEDTPELLPLDDPTRYREYWHRVWSGTFSRTVKRETFDCRYYYLLAGDTSANARMETLTQETSRSLKGRTSRLKTGMKLSPTALMRLLPLLSRESPDGAEAIDEDEIRALESSDFADRFSQVARTTVEFRGRDGQGVSLWAHPVMKLQRVILKKIATSNQHGHVTAMEERALRFPMPVMVQLIGLEEG